jgi:hypothetical protein
MIFHMIKNARDKNVSSLGGLAIKKKLGKKGWSALCSHAATVRWTKWRAAKAKKEAQLEQRRVRDRARRAQR